MLNLNTTFLVLKKYCYAMVICLTFLLFTAYASAGTLTAIQVDNQTNQTQVQFKFNSKTEYRYFYLTNPHRLVIDFPNSQTRNGILPYRVSNGAITAVRLNNPPRPNTLRLVVDLKQKAEVKFRTQGNNIIISLPNSQATTNSSNQQTVSSKARTQRAPVWTIAIDPGHGGKDPGAIGRNLKIYEKNVTLSIARELKALLDADPNFRGVLTRNGDYYISVPERSEIARKNKANYLVSIHADSSTSPNLRGASVWVLSNRRANSEMGRWLEDHEKQSELLGGAGDVLSNNREKYLNQTVLDLQFGHSQRAGYELGSIVLRHFSAITKLSKSTPQHASLGVLRSPDIPSILVETGFLSNADEEKKLNTLAYRKRVARIIYNGLVEYRKKNIQAEMPPENINTPSTTIVASGVVHNVTRGETLLGVANRYKVKAEDIVALNNLKSRNLLIGQKLQIPGQGTANSSANNNPSQQHSTTIQTSSVEHSVTQGETLTGIANRYKVTVNDIVAFNNLKSRNIQIGQRLKIPAPANNITSTQNNNASSAVKNNKNIPKTLVIKRGQTLSAVSREYGIPLRTLLALNPTLKDGRVQAGQRITLREN